MYPGRVRSTGTSSAALTIPADNITSKPEQTATAVAARFRFLMSVPPFCLHGDTCHGILLNANFIPAFSQEPAGTARSWPAGADHRDSAARLRPAHGGSIRPSLPAS